MTGYLAGFQATWATDISLFVLMGVCPHLYHYNVEYPKAPSWDHSSTYYSQMTSQTLPTSTLSLTKLQGHTAESVAVQCAMLMTVLLAMVTLTQ